VSTTAEGGLKSFFTSEKLGKMLQDAVVDAAADNLVATAEKLLSGCGNGQRVESEICDDGNKKSGDGCSSACTVERGFTCEGGSPSTADVCTASPPPPPKCGDGIRAASEACDDGNEDSEDGCSSACVPEPGFTCDGGSDSTPDICTADDVDEAEDDEEEGGEDEEDDEEEVKSWLKEKFLKLFTMECTNNADCREPGKPICDNTPSAESLGTVAAYGVAYGSSIVATAAVSQTAAAAPFAKYIGDKVFSTVKKATKGALEQGAQQFIVGRPKGTFTCGAKRHYGDNCGEDK
jgi:cysteine-rich repeat protein